MAFGKNKAPFVIQESTTGLEIDIFREALAYKGHTLSIVHVDNKGLIPALLSDRVDAVATARDSQNRFCVVEKFIEFDNVAISLSNREIKLKSVDDLKKFTIVAWENAYQDLGSEFHQKFKPDLNGLLPDGYIEHRNQESQNVMFWAGRADIILVDRTIFSWYQKQLSTKFKTDQPLDYHNIFGEKTYFPALFNDGEICEDFKIGLANLKEKKRYRQLFKVYTH